ncbi:MAG: Gfo/Idh/MocA family oxidoreductase [Anaerolineae bacterium]|nr:Gfo/Idh/MocA family oxidoreductase [Anaerolineae bacterium]
MSANNPLRVAVIGCGGMAWYHLRGMLQQQDTARIEVICDPAPRALEGAASLFKEAGLQPPPVVPDLGELLDRYAGGLEVALIATPHVYHHDQARACLEAGLDVLLEKPMVMSADEARSLIETRDRTGRLLVVAFQGSLSPQVRTAARLLRSGELGQILNISAVVWQGWRWGTAGTWRQQPEMSGGGFLFDTGAHMLNTVADLAGEDFDQVAAWLDNRGTPVDILAAVMARLKSGALVTLNGCGEAIPSAGSEVYVYCTQGIVRTGIWGERLEVQRAGRRRLRKVPLPRPQGVWEQFVAVREGRMANPCPPEVGLRMARLWDAIRASAAQDGAPVRCD